jgi:hypothetical protein
MKTIYECLQSKSVKWISAIFYSIVILSVFVIMHQLAKGVFNLTTAWVIMALILIPSILSFFIFPVYIVADDEGVGVRTLARTKLIPYENIDRIVRVDEQPLFSRLSTIRLFGSGGVFGYIGWFRSKGIGTFLSYATDEKNVFLIYRKNGKPVAISVNDPDEFMPYYLKGGEK